MTGELTALLADNDGVEPSASQRMSLRVLIINQNYHMDTENASVILTLC